MKKVFTLVAIAMVSVAVLSSCDSPKSLAKQAMKAIEKGDLKKLNKISAKVEKLSEAEQQEFTLEIASLALQHPELMEKAAEMERLLDD